MVACNDLTDIIVRAHAYSASQAQRRPKHWLVGRSAKVPHAQDVHQYLRRCRVRCDSAPPHYDLLYTTSPCSLFFFSVFSVLQFEIERLMIIERLRRSMCLACGCGL
jgi:hypothetical protein